MKYPCTLQIWKNTWCVQNVFWTVSIGVHRPSFTLFVFGRTHFANSTLNTCRTQFRCSAYRQHGQHCTAVGLLDEFLDEMFLILWSSWHDYLIVKFFVQRQYRDAEKLSKVTLLSKVAPVDGTCIMYACPLLYRNVINALP